MAARSDTIAMLRRECLLSKARENTGEYVRELSQSALLEKWSKYLGLQIELATTRDEEKGTTGKGVTAVLADIREMCPGVPTSLEVLEGVCQEAPFYTPWWSGRTAATDIPPRKLSPQEIDVINRTYIELRAVFLEKRRGQEPGAALADAEDNLTAQARWNHKETEQAIGRVEALLKPVAALCGGAATEDPQERMAARRLQIAALRKANADDMQEVRQAAEKRKSTAQDKSTRNAKSERFAFRADSHGAFFWIGDDPVHRIADADAPPAGTRYTLVRVMQRLQWGGQGSSFLCYDATDTAKKPRVESELFRWTRKVRINDAGLPKTLRDAAGLEGDVEEERAGSCKVGVEGRRSMWVSMAHLVWLPPPGTDMGQAGGGEVDAAAAVGDAAEVDPPADARAVEADLSAAGGVMEADSPLSDALLPLPETPRARAAVEESIALVDDSVARASAPAAARHERARRKGEGSARLPKAKSAAASKTSGRRGGGSKRVTQEVPFHAGVRPRPPRIVPPVPKARDIALCGQ